LALWEYFFVKFVLCFRSVKKRWLNVNRLVAVTMMYFDLILLQEWENKKL